RSDGLFPEAAHGFATLARSSLVLLDLPRAVRDLRWVRSRRRSGGGGATDPPARRRLVLEAGAGQPATGRDGRARSRCAERGGGKERSGRSPAHLRRDADNPETTARGRPAA